MTIELLVILGVYLVGCACTAINYAIDRDGAKGRYKKAVGWEGVYMPSMAPEAAYDFAEANRKMLMAPLWPVTLFLFTTKHIRSARAENLEILKAAQRSDAA